MAIGPKVSVPDVPSPVGVASNEPLPLLQSIWNSARPSAPKLTVNLLGSGTVVVPCTSSIDWIATSRQLVPSSVGAAAADAHEQATNSTATPSKALIRAI